MDLPGDWQAVEALAAKVSELAQTCDQLTRDNAMLRDELSELRSDPEPAADRAALIAARVRDSDAPAEHLRRPVSRRTIGKVLGAAAAGVVGGGTLAELGSRDTASAAAVSHQAAAVPQQPAAAARSAAGASVLNAAMSTTTGVVVVDNTGAGAGVQASSSHGVGGVFAGSAAQVRLVASGKSHPAAGTRGDLFADATGRLWFCKKSGSHAKWQQIA